MVHSPNHRLLFEGIADILGLKQPEDWYSVTRSQILKANGSLRTVLLHHYEDSHSKALVTLFPGKFRPWLFPSVPKGYWGVFENQRAFLKAFAKDNSILKWQDWYQVSANDLKRAGGGTLINFFGGPIRVITNVFPEFPWQVWKFHSVSQNFWKEKFNRILYLEQVAKDLQLVNAEDWYQVSREDLRQRGGSGLLQIFNNSLYKVLEGTFPEHQWLVWRFRDHVPADFWKDERNRLAFFEKLGQHLEYQTWEDFYHLKKKDVDEFGGAWVVQNFGSVRNALISLYPQYDWKPWRFTSTTRGFYEELDNVKEVLEDIGKELKIQTLDDWYQVSLSQFTSTRLGSKGITILNKYGGLLDLLPRVYPHHPWEDHFRITSKFNKTQNHLFRSVQEILGYQGGSAPDVHLNFLHPDLRFVETDAPMELDIFVPSLRLAFEYQGEQHYEASKMFPESKAKSHDEEKRAACKQQGITLIEIPHWWDLSIESLEATICKHRPDVVPSSARGVPIPEFLPEVKEDADFGEKKDVATTPQVTRNFILNFGVKYGTAPKCRACRRPFDDRLDLRVQVLSESLISSYCLSAPCIENAVRHYKKRSQFDGKIGVPPHMRKWVETEKLPAVEGVEWTRASISDEELVNLWCFDTAVVSHKPLTYDDVPWK